MRVHTTSAAYTTTTALISQKTRSYKQSVKLDGYRSDGLLGGSGEEGDASDGGSGGSDKPGVHRGGGFGHEGITVDLVGGGEAMFLGVYLTVGQVGVVGGVLNRVGFMVISLGNTRLGSLDDVFLAGEGRHVGLLAREIVLLGHALLGAEVKGDDRGKGVDDGDGTDLVLGDVASEVLGGVLNVVGAGAGAAVAGIIFGYVWLSFRYAPLDLAHHALL